MKPHKGVIIDWRRVAMTPEQIEYYKNKGEDTGLNYYIKGTCVNHPNYGYGPMFRTSWIMSHDEETGEIETRNSRYTLN